MSKRSSLRGAIGAIRPKVALNLSKSPKFVPPSKEGQCDEWTENNRQGPKSDQGQKSTQAENGPQGLNSDQTSLKAQPERDSSLPNENLPQGTISTQGQKMAQDEESPQEDLEDCTVEPDRPDASEISLEEDEDAAKGMSPEERFSRNLEKLRTGSSYISNNFLKELIHGDYSKAEIKVALLVARFTYGFQRRQSAKLSKRVIERYTGLKGSTILEAERGLEAKKLVKKTSGDKLTSSRLQIKIPTIPWNGPSTPKPPKPPKTSNPIEVEKRPQVEKEPQGQKSDQTWGKNGAHPQAPKEDHPQGQKSTHFKEESSNHILKSYLSKNSGVPPELISRWIKFENEKNTSILIREIQVYDGLLAKFGEPFRQLCAPVITFLESQGVEKAGACEPIRNGMLYIENHWALNLSRFQERQAKITAKTNAEAATAEAERKKAEEEEKLAQIRLSQEHLLVAFTETFSEEVIRTQVIESAVCQSETPQIQASWHRLGWSSPLVQNYVLNLFATSPEQLFQYAGRPLIEEASA